MYPAAIPNAYSVATTKEYSESGDNLAAHDVAYPLLMT